MGKTAKWALISATCVGLYAVIGFLIAPPIIRSQIESVLTEQLSHPVTVKEVRLNPFALSLTLRDLAISERDDSPLLGFDELYVNVELASIVNQAVTFSTIHLLAPYALARVRQDGTINLMDLHSSAPVSDGPPDSTAPVPQADSNENALPGIIIESFHVDRGILEFHDDSKPTPFTAHVVPITFTLQNFSTRTDSQDSLSFTAEVGPGEKIDWHGTLHLQPLRSEGTVALTGLKARTLWTYMQDLVKFEITDGVIDLTASYKVRSDRDSFQASVGQAAVKLTTFALGEKGSRDPLIVIPELTIEGIEADLATREARIAAVSSRDARIAGWLDKEGSTNLQKLFASDVKEAAPAQIPSSQTETTSSATPWLVKINQVSIDDYGIILEDRTPTTPVRLTLDPLRIKLTNVTSRLDDKIDLDLFVLVNETGTVAVTGGVTAEPLTMDLNLDVSKIAFAPFQPYLDPIAQLNVRSGAASLKGHLSYHPKNGTKPQMRFDGTAGVTELLTQDKLLNKDFLRWSDLALNSFTLEIDPTRVSIAEIVTVRPYFRFIIGPDRTTNVQQIFTKPDLDSGIAESPPLPSDSTNPSAQPTVPVQIGAIRLVDGSTHFADFSLKPVIDTGIFGLHGTIKGLSSKERSKADVSLDGKVDKYAPVAIKGKINPLTSDAFSDVAVSFKNVELTTVSPYSTKFAGYPITKGKISVDLRYKLSKNVLEAENKVVIDQLTLGEKTESPDATSLPVKLAIALLKDRNGVIDIDLPVRGDLNSPDFKYGRVLLDVLVNLITKAVLSPFNLVAGLVGGSGEELSVVEFPVGTDTLTSVSEGKLTSLAKALTERPGLRVEIAGAADGEVDRAALAEMKLNQDLIAFRDADLKPTGKPTPENGAISRLSETEQAALVKALYLKKFGKLPESLPTPGQTDKPAPVSIQTLKDRLLSDITIGEGEIRLLGQERARRIQDYLVTQGSIPPERIYLLDIKVDAQARDGSVSSNLSLNAL